MWLGSLYDTTVFAQCALMDKAHFVRAEEHIAACSEKAAAIAAERDFARSGRLWSEFLVEHHRWFTRMQQAFSKGPSSAWFGKLKAKRSTNELLVYMQQARHADEHGLDRVAEKASGQLMIGRPGTTTNIRSLRLLENGRVVVDGSQDGGPLDVELVPPHLQLMKVENRGVTYGIPRDSNGHKMTAVTASAACVDFMCEMASEGRKFFGE